MRACLVLNIDIFVKLHHCFLAYKVAYIQQYLKKHGHTKKIATILICLKNMDKNKELGWCQ